MIGVFVIYSITFSLLFGVSDNVLTISLQTIISIKFFIILLAFIELFKNHYKTLNKFFLFMIGFAVLGLLIHLFFGIKFNHWVGISAFARPDIRYVGFFTHPNHLAYLMVLYVGYILNKKYTISQALSFRDLIKIIGSLIIIILTDSRTAMLAIGILLFAFYWMFFKNNYKIILNIIFFGFMGVLYVFFYTNLLNSIIENINQTLDLTSHYIRGNMIYLSGLIFLDYFPIGTGAATFGSLLSDDKVYALYGQADRYYFANEMGIYDSNIASIVGEYGFIGIIFFFFFFYYLITHLKSFTLSKTLIVPLIVVFLFYSITNPMLTNNLYTILTSIILVLFVTGHGYKINKDLK
ncbi:MULTISPECIES: O-antigen ligase family protein [Flavobacteriaceae]|uniref:O-antigen ligase family protein n=1 Tax=Flavobacteriaceae TaxID=49546 RepID=UPI003A92A9EB